MTLTREKLERAFQKAGIIYKERQSLIMRILLFLYWQSDHRFEDRPTGRVGTLIAGQLGLDPSPSLNRIRAVFNEMEKMGLIGLERGARRTYAIWLLDDIDSTLIEWMKTRTGWAPTLVVEPESELEEEAVPERPEIRPSINYEELGQRIDLAHLLEAGVAYVLRRIPEVGFSEALAFAERFFRQAVVTIQEARQRIERVAELEAEIARAQGELEMIRKKLAGSEAQYREDEDLIRRQARTIRELQATIEQLKDSVEKLSKSIREDRGEEERREIDRLMRQKPHRRES